MVNAISSCLGLFMQHVEVQRRRMWRYRGAVVLAIALLLLAIVLCVVQPLPIDWGGLSFPTGHGGKEFLQSISAEAGGRSTQCRSRGEYGRYLAPLPAPPSLALWKALALYDRRHALCLTMAQLHSGDISGSAPAPAPAPAGDGDGDGDGGAQYMSDGSCSYLVYLEGHEGLGNRIMSLVSAFLYALLTDRVLLMDSRRHLSKLLCEPFSSPTNSSWVLPPSFPYSALLASAGAPGRGQQLTDDPHEWVYHAQLRHDQSPADQQFWSASTQERLRTVPWLTWSSNQYLVPRFFALPSLWPRLAALFPSHPSLAFSHLARYLLLPVDEAWEHAINAHAAHLAGSDASVGLQVRAQFMKPRGAFSRAVLDRTMECLTTRMGIASYIGTQTNKGRMHRVAILVASLQGRYHAEMKRTFMERHHKRGPGSPLVSVYTLSQEKRERHTWDQDLKAFVEMWVLSMCDELATSSWSTFGYVARGLRGRRSWLLDIRADHLDVHRGGGSATTVEVCFDQESSDPCNHYPFLMNETPINNATLLNTSSSMDAWTNEHLSHCIDERNGIRLVDG